MAISELAGKPAPESLLIDPRKLEREYYENRPDPKEPRQRVSFGTSGHRGTTADCTFTEAHILAISQAICEYRRREGIEGPLFMGKDTHALSGPAQRTALEVLAANAVETIIQPNDGYTPTPVISRAILDYNRGRSEGLGDGIVITPSHNPPQDGGFKYNPPDGGPAETETTSWIQDRANDLLAHGNTAVRRVPYEQAMRAATTHRDDFVAPYVHQLATVVDMERIRASGVRIGVDPLGGASCPYWKPIKEQYSLDLTVVNTSIDPTFRFMPVDHDGKIRMDCSSPYAMANLVRLKDEYDIAFGNDPDADRHGIVTRSAGLMNPNHYLAVAIRYLLASRTGWPEKAAVGKTVVSSSMIDRVVEKMGRRLAETPVGFKYFAKGLKNASYCFGGEESAGASFLQRNGTVWTTDKDGIILALLSAEIIACTGKDPGEHYRELVAQFGEPFYARIDAPATPEQKAALKLLTPEAVAATELAGDPITARLTRSPEGNEPIGGLKVATEHGWFAARPSGTENIYKVYAESFRSQEHLARIIEEARKIVNQTLAAGAQ